MAKTTAQPINIRAAMEALTPLRREFIDWMMNPASHTACAKGLNESHVKFKTQKEWAEAHGLNPGTVKYWKREPKFRAAWTAREMEVGLDPNRVRDLIDFMFTQAIEKRDRHVGLSLLRFIEKWTPRSYVELDHLRDLTVLDDDQLDELIELERETRGTQSQHP